MPTPQSCVEALFIEFGLSLPYAFRYKRPVFLSPTPLPPRMSRTTFYVRWHRILKSVMHVQGGGVFFFFPCAAWWRVTIYCVWLYLGSREYWLFDLTLAERRRRIAIPTVVVERQCHSSVVAELFAPDGPF